METKYSMHEISVYKAPPVTHSLMYCETGSFLLKSDPTAPAADVPELTVLA